MLCFNEEEKKKANKLFDRAEKNLRALELVSRYLNYCPRFVREADLRELTEDVHLPEEKAYALLMAAACGLNEDENPEDRELQQEYFLRGVTRLDTFEIRQDPYYAAIHMPEVERGRWKFGTKRLEAYEAFPSDDPLLLPDGREIPRVSYFPEAFETPVVYENGREWMTVTPSERNTMLSHVNAVHGRIAVFGLGLGYYAFMAARKPDVREIVVIEKDPEVIQLFREFLLPQFPDAKKITVLCADAFDYFAKLSQEEFDWAYVDLWHDVLDGAELYLRMKRLETGAPQTHFLYWIEPSILAWLRSLFLYEARSGEGPLLAMLGKIETAGELKAAVSDEALKILAPKIPLEAILREGN